MQHFDLIVTVFEKVRRNFRSKILELFSWGLYAQMSGLDPGDSASYSEESWRSYWIGSDLLPYLRQLSEEDMVWSEP